MATVSNVDELKKKMEDLLNENKFLFKDNNFNTSSMASISAVDWECSVETGSDGKPVVKCRIGGSF